MRTSPFTRESLFWNTEHFFSWNPKSQALTASTQPSPRNPKFRKESGIFHRYSESEIHRVEFRIQDCLGQTYMRRRIAVPLYRKQITKKQAEKGRNNITYNSNFLTYQCLLFCDFIQWQEKISQSYIDMQVFQVSESMKRTFLLELPEQLQPAPVSKSLW